MMPWGVESLPIVERYKRALEAGVNLFSGTADPGLLIQTLKAYPDLMPLVDLSAQKTLKVKFQFGLFENPYVEVTATSQIVGKEDFKKKANEAMRKSIVLLRNKEEMLPLKSKTKVYFESYMQRGNGAPSNVYSSDNNSWGIEFVSSPEEADVVLLWLIPKGKSLFQSDGRPLHVDLSNNGVDVDYVNKLTNKRTILVVNYTNPWAIDDIFNDDSGTIKSVMAIFGTTPEAV
ncbi:MAG: beta-glucosidase [Saprospiraceae bacterium]|jgi:beta-glucosidase